MHICVHVYICTAMHICIQAKKWGLYRINLFVTSSYKSPTRELGEFRNCHNMLFLVGRFGVFLGGAKGGVIPCFT